MNAIFLDPRMDPHFAALIREAHESRVQLVVHDERVLGPISNAAFLDRDDPALAEVERVATEEFNRLGQLSDRANRMLVDTNARSMPELLAKLGVADLVAEELYGLRQRATDESVEAARTQRWADALAFSVLSDLLDLARDGGAPTASAEAPGISRSGSLAPRTGHSAPQWRARC